MFCAVAAVAFASGGVAACGKDDSAPGNDGAGGATVTYEISSTTGKPFKVAYVEKTDTDNIADLKNAMANTTASSSWRKEVALSKGTDYALVVVSPDPTNFDTATKYSCKITSGGKTIDEKKDQGGIVIGCAGLKFQDQVKLPGQTKKEGS